MGKTLFEKARDVQEGILESRLVARMETEGRPLTDEETINELKYQLDDLPYKGLEPEDERKCRKAIRYLLQRYIKSS